MGFAVSLHIASTSMAIALINIMREAALPVQVYCSTLVLLQQPQHLFRKILVGNTCGSDSCVCCRLSLLTMQLWAAAPHLFELDEQYAPYQAELNLAGMLIACLCPAEDTGRAQADLQTDHSSGSVQPRSLLSAGHYITGEESDFANGKVSYMQVSFGTDS